MNLKSIAGQVLIVVVTFHASYAGALSSADYQTISQAAALAQHQCFKEMYRDPNAYSQCIRDLRNGEKKSVLKKLGIDYFGFVGALSYRRVGHLNADQIAAEFLKAYRPVQKNLGLSDEVLCSTIPGNCTVRIAQTRQMEAAPPARREMRMQCVDKICSMTPVQ